MSLEACTNELSGIKETVQQLNTGNLNSNRLSGNEETAESLDSKSPRNQATAQL